MKVRKRNDNTLKANKIFTDREEPRAAFWKNYNLLKDNLTNNADIKVLTYYGIGGIGKSSLLKKIISELEEKIKEPRYVYYDFQMNQESRLTLQSLRNQLSERYHFEFPLFDIGNYVYAKKMGEKPDSIEIKSMMKNSPILSLFINAAGMLPGAAMISQMISVADSGVSLVKRLVKNHEIELKEI